MVNDPDRVKRYHNRAVLLRSLAAGIKDPQIRADVERWAKTYDTKIELAKLGKSLDQPDQISN